MTQERDEFHLGMHSSQCRASHKFLLSSISPCTQEVARGEREEETERKWSAYGGNCV